jgi:hypothetical protein
VLCLSESHLQQPRCQQQGLVAPPLEAHAEAGRHRQRQERAPLPEALAGGEAPPRLLVHPRRDDEGEKEDQEDEVRDPGGSGGSNRAPAQGRDEEDVEGDVDRRGDQSADEHGNGDALGGMVKKVKHWCYVKKQGNGYNQSQISLRRCFQKFWELEGCRERWQEFQQGRTVWPSPRYA